MPLMSERLHLGEGGGHLQGLLTLEQGSGVDLKQVQVSMVRSVPV